jgi:hypothetical protein
MRCVKEHVPQLRRIMRSQLGALNLKLAHTKRKTLSWTADSDKEQEL